MRKSLKWMLAVGSMAGALVVVGRAGATSATTSPKFSGNTIASATFERFNIRTHYEYPAAIGGTEDDDESWTASQKTSGRSDLYVQSNTWEPGADTGWHSHPGYSLIIVTAGEITAYDESCNPEVFKSGGSGLVDANHVHLIRNEGSGEARATVVQLVAAGATRRIDQPAPASCPVR